MAYTQNPVISTVVKKRYDFTGSFEQRDATGNKDQKYINFVPEKTVGINKGDTQWWLKSRPGMSAVYTMPAGVLRGIYFWNAATPAHMSVIGNSIYYNGTFLSTITTTTGSVGFTEFLDSTGARKLVLVDGTDGYVFTAYNVAPTKIVDADFPTPHIPTPIFLDGYLFLAKANTQDVYNSNLDDPALWTAGDFISAEMFPDTIVGLSRNNNYIYAIGQYSTEFLYDAANATASPLARHPSALQQFGTPNINTVVATDQDVTMVAELQLGGRTVYTIDGFKETEIATPAVQLALNAEGTNISNASAFGIKLGGQKLYVLTLTNRVLCWGYDDKIWFEWNFVNTPKFATDSAVGYPYMLTTQSGTNYIVAFTPNSSLDVANVITCTIVTSKFDFDTMDRKRMDLLVLMGDSPLTTNVPISVQTSDDDYNTWSTARTLNINPIFTGLYRMGMFRRRALKFTYTQPYPLRLEGMELTINKGQT